MRVMVCVKATEESEAGVMPSEQLLTEMGKFNEELVKAGVLLAGVPFVGVFLMGVPLAGASLTGVSLTVCLSQA